MMLWRESLGLGSCIYIYICIVDNILILIITSESTLSPIYVSQKRKEGERYFLRLQYIKGNSFQGGSGKSEPFSRYFDKHVKNVSRVYTHALYIAISTFQARFCG